MENQFKRAKSTENKEIRIHQIMDITDRLFHEQSYHDISLSVISEAAGFARGGLYKYVSSKEEIFLLIYQEKQAAFIEQLCTQYQKSDGTVSSFINCFVFVMEENMDYLKYHQILNAIIETNTSVEKLAQFKIKNKVQHTRLYETVQNILPVSFEDFFNLYLIIVYHGVYLYDRVVLRENFIEAMRLANLPIDPVDFKEEYTDFIEMYLSHFLNKLN